MEIMKNIQERSEGESDIYRKLQQHLDKCPTGFPATESGIEIKILKRLFTSEEAQIAINLSTSFPEKLNKIHRRLKSTGILYEELEQKLDAMIQKGLILGGDVFRMLGPGKYYSNAQYLVGLHEFSLNKLDEELVRIKEEYFNSDEYLNEFFNPLTPFQFRIVPVKRSISSLQNVSNFDDIYQIVKNSEGPFAVMDCICRKNNDIKGEPCIKTHLRESCISLNEGASSSLAAGVSREINKKELLERLRIVQKEGLIFNPSNSQKPHFICTCCGDCCEVLSALRRLPKPVDYINSNYFVNIDLETCEGCETCMDRCYMQALKIIDGVSRVDLDRCIGCGNCVSTCPSNSMQLLKKENEIIPPKDLQDLLTQQLMNKAKIQK